MPKLTPEVKLAFKQIKIDLLKETLSLSIELNSMFEADRETFRKAWDLGFDTALGLLLEVSEND